MTNKTPSFSIDELRHAYLEEKLPIADICERFNLKRHRLYALVNAHNWERRRPQQKLARPTGAVDKQHKPPSRRNTPFRPDQLVERLFRNLEQQMNEIDARLSAASSVNDVASADRDARTLSSLARTLEKLIELEHSGPAHKEARRDRHADELREALAKKIERLSADRKTNGNAGSAG